jgi:Domain of unknown function (DUF4410)
MTRCCWRGDCAPATCPSANPNCAPSTLVRSLYRLINHLKLEEELLFPAFRTVLGVEATLIDVLLSDHRELRPKSALRERELTKLMSSALVNDLTRDGLNAQFLPSSELLPSEGWLVRGAFVQVDEGNRLRRAFIGFGSGATRLRVIVWVSELGHGSSGPFCALDTSTHSSRTPGAALSLDPYVGAARFVIDGLDLDMNVTQIAVRIAEDISERSRTGKPPDNWRAQLSRFF